jgi:hypothetical protein
MRNIARFLFYKGFGGVGSSINDEMFKLIMDITDKQTYNPTIVIDEKFKEKLDSTIATPKFRLGFCAILELIAQLKYNKNERKNCISIANNNSKTRPQVEHILAKKWDKSIDSDLHDEWRAHAIKALNTLGNLCLLESELNQKGSNDKVQNKLNNFYSISKFAIAKNLFNDIKKGFNYRGDYSDRQKQCVDKLVEFFTGKKK